MNKREILLVFALVLLLGCFFQFSRMDGFLHLFPLNGRTQLADGAYQGEPVDVGREKFLILYDPRDVGSVFARHRLTELLNRQKKEAVSASVYDEEVKPDSSYRGVLVATGRLDRVAALPELRQYVADGGTAAVLMRLERGGDGIWPDAELLNEMGIASLGNETEVRGIRLQTDFLFGGKGVSFGEGSVYFTSCTQAVLTEDTVPDICSEDGMPLVWQHAVGAGRYLVYNGTVRDDKTNAGILTAMLAHCGQDGIYPVLGTKLFFIDDFPSPVPEGTDPKIYDEMHLTTEDFYRERWWPFMRQCAESFGLKYTGLIIESYGDQVKGPFTPPAGRRDRDNFIRYSRELLDMGGELGLHGYNHQSLAPVGYNQGDLGYVPWESQEDMIESLQELRRYVRDIYPSYSFRSYVPPSDILSPEGLEAVRTAFPEIRVFSSLFDGAAADRAYITDYSRREDGTFEIPRTTAGYIPSGQNRYEQISVINYIGSFSHFVHPDELFYEESQSYSWAMMEQGLRDFLTDLNQRYGWLRPVTDSECAEYLADYLDMDYRVIRYADHLELYCWNYRHPLRFILRTGKEIDHASGAVYQRVGEDCYMIEIQEPKAELYWKEAD